MTHQSLFRIDRTIFPISQFFINFMFYSSTVAASTGLSTASSEVSNRIAW